MNDLNVLFVDVGSYCRRDVITCKPADRLVDVAAIMLQHNISSLVVIENGNLSGILTDRDMRNKVVAQGIDPSELSVKEVMSTPPITIKEEEFLFEALHLLSRHRIHRLVVTDQKPDNRLTLERLNRMEQEQLRAALEMVSSFQGILQRRFREGQMM